MKTELNSKEYVSFARRFVKELVEDMDIEELRKQFCEYQQYDYDFNGDNNWKEEEDGEEIILDEKESTISKEFSRNISKIKSTKSLIFSYLSKF